MLPPHTPPLFPHGPPWLSPSLTDGQVEVLELDTLERASSLPGLKGATLFAAERDPQLAYMATPALWQWRGPCADGLAIPLCIVPTSRQPRVCVGLRKKVLLFKYDHVGTFQPHKEFNLPDVVLALEWWKPSAAARGEVQTPPLFV